MQRDDSSAGCSVKVSYAGRPVLLSPNEDVLGVVSQLLSEADLEGFQYLNGKELVVEITQVRRTLCKSGLAQSLLWL